MMEKQSSSYPEMVPIGIQQLQIRCLKKLENFERDRNGIVTPASLHLKLGVYQGGGSIDVFCCKHVLCCVQDKASPIHGPLKSMGDCKRFSGSVL